MKQVIKRIVNSVLKTFNLQLVSAFNGIIDGRFLQHDLPLFILNDKPVVVDVGANTGQTIDLMLALFDNPHIYAFEPFSEAFQELTEKGYPDSINLFNYALGNNTTSRELISLNDSVLNSFLPVSNDNRNPFFEKSVSRAKGQETVEIRKLDDVNTIQEIRHIDLLKIDTQGYDLEVLKGAEATLRSHKIDYILIEINFVEIYQSQGHYIDILTFLDAHGYYLVDLYEKVRHPKQCGSISWATVLFCNRSLTQVAKNLQAV